jgi:hypothetical protein
MHKVIFMRKSEAHAIHGGLSQTTKMPCKSNSLPTEACDTGFEMAKIEGSICNKCYANKGNYAKYAGTIKPAQFARLDALNNPHWVGAMVVSIGADPYFRWHDSGDIQGLWHFENIVAVAKLTPKTLHWLPTREYKIIKAYIDKHGRDSIPDNLIVRLSAMYIDKPVIVPKSLQGIRGITVSNVHTTKPIGNACNAPAQNGECRECRTCWTSAPVSYAYH